jgi:hypothetical protein
MGVRAVLFVLLAGVALGAPHAPARADDPIPVSLVDWLKQHGKASAFEDRRALFVAAFPGTPYTGTAEQNRALLRALLAGKVEAPDAAARPIPPPTPPPSTVPDIPDGTPLSPSTPPSAPEGPTPAPLPTEPGAPAPVCPDPSPPPPPPQRPHLPPTPPSRNRRRPLASREPRIVLDRSSQVLHAAAPLRVVLVPPDATGEAATPAAPMSATLSATDGRFVSASLLFAKAKAFDDGLLAAIELAAQEGAGSQAGKKALLAELRSRLATVDGEAAGRAPALLYAASALGGATVRTPERLQGIADREKLAFLADDVRSKPVGFWTADTLWAIFRQDRMLQRRSARQGRRGCRARAEGGRPGALGVRGYLFLTSSSLGPFVSKDLRWYLAALDRARSPAARARSFLPACAARWSPTWCGWGDSGMPEDADLSRARAGVRAGEIALDPGATAGTAVSGVARAAARPRRRRGPRLESSKEYGERLENLFRGGIALARETFIKGLETPPTGKAAAPPPQARVTVTPGLSIEPLPTVYRRRADAYGFARGLLEDTFGPGAFTAVRARAAHRS